MRVELLLLGYGESNVKCACLNICCDNMHAFLDSIVDFKLI